MRIGSRLCGILLLGIGAAPGASQEPENWVVEAEPFVELGELDGDDVLVNPLAGFRLPDGTLVIQNSTRNLFEIRYYDPDGQHRRTVSRWGQGPYEFTYLLGLFRIEGDSLLALGRDDRFAVFGPAGARGRDGRAGTLAAAPVRSAVQVSSTHIGLLKHLATGMPPPGTSRAEVSVLLHDLYSETAVEIAVTRDQMLFTDGDGPESAAYLVPFSPQLLVAGGGGMLWVGDATTGVIFGYRPGESEPGVEVVVDHPRRAVDSEARDRVREAYQGQYSGPGAQRQMRILASMEFPEKMPVVDQLRVDRVGNLWIQLYEPFWTEGPQSWVVFDRSGLQTAAVQVPASALPPCSRRFQAGCGLLAGVLEIGDDYFMVRRSDELGVQRVAMFRLRKER